MVAHSRFINVEFYPKSHSYLNWINQTGAKPQFDVCAVINYPSVPRGKWFYLDCVDVAYAVCEKDLGKFSEVHNYTSVRIARQPHGFSLCRVVCEKDVGN